MSFVNLNSIILIKLSNTSNQWLYEKDLEWVPVTNDLII